MGRVGSIGALANEHRGRLQTILISKAHKISCAIAFLRLANAWNYAVYMCCIIE